MLPLPDLSIPSTADGGRVGLDWFRYHKALDFAHNALSKSFATLSAIFPSTAPAAGRVPVGNAGGTAYAPVSISGDATLASTGALTVTKLNNVSPGAFYNGTDAANLSGTVASARIAGAYTGITAVGILTALTLHPAASVTPANNGDLIVEATNNTTLTFKFKGSDGTVRIAALTLA